MATPRVITAAGTTWPDRYTFSPALKVGNLLFLAGTTAVDDTGALVAPGDIVGQTRFILQKFGKLLDAAGANFSHVVETTEYVTTTENYRGTAGAARFFRPPYRRDGRIVGRLGGRADRDLCGGGAAGERYGPITAPGAHPGPPGRVPPRPPGMRSGTDLGGGFGERSIAEVRSMALRALRDFLTASLSERPSISKTAGGARGEELRRAA